MSGAPKFLLTPEVSLSSNTKKLSLQLLVWCDELLSTSKVTTFLAKPLPKLHESFPSNAYNIPSEAITKTPWIVSIKCYSIANIHVLTCITIFYYIIHTKQEFFQCQISKNNIKFYLNQTI